MHGILIADCDRHKTTKMRGTPSSDCDRYLVTPMSGISETSRYRSGDSQT